MSQDIFRGFAIVVASGLVALMIFLSPTSCATCPAGDTSARCTVQAGAVDCAKALAGPQGADIIATVTKDLADGASGAAWISDLVGLAERVGMATVECAMGQLAGQYKGNAMTISQAKSLERIRIWKTLPKDAKGFPVVPKAKAAP